ncbi:MAG: hypothetical protein FJ027_14955 [Candidatus Rokubacteria bacterium]|nr:hypothetical protein [Candidatus Rokubacteria bacterium]
MPDEADHSTRLVERVAPTVLTLVSRARCWHGEDIVIRVRTTAVPDDAAVELKILVVGSDAEVDSVKDLKITSGALNHTYTIDWKAKGVAAEAREFAAVAIITDPALTSRRSPSFFVDRAEPFFSG